MASLLTIPLELLVAISALLPTEDLGALRLVCKQTEKSLYEWFSQEFFSKKQFMLTHTSLQALIDISKHAIYRETGVRLSFADRGSYSPEITTRFVSRIFSSVLYALGKANRQPPQFEVLLRQHGLLDSAFFLPDFLLPTIEPVLRNMTTLLLSVSLVIRLLHTHSNGASADLHPGRSLRHFLRHTPNLTHLRLNFEKHLVANNEAFLSWLSTPPPTTTMPVSFLHPDPIALPLLKTLELGQQSVRADILISLIAKFAPTLEDLSLWRMNIHSFTHIPMGHQPNFWRDFFNKVSRIPQLNLNHLKVGMLQQDHSHVNFREKEDAKSLKVKEHTGNGMD
ncbi:hypothetical protein GGP41_006034, partial [Bipolaris sorokiniana]